MGTETVGPAYKEFDFPTLSQEARQGWGNLKFDIALAARSSIISRLLNDVVIDSSSFIPRTGTLVPFIALQLLA